MNERQSGSVSSSVVDGEFIGAAEKFRLEGFHSDALVLLLKGLSENPSHHQARLLLARVFFELGCVPFALNELAFLSQRFPKNENLKKLIRELGGNVAAAQSESMAAVVAESEIDFDAIEGLEEE